MSVHVCINFTDKEVAYIRDNYKVYTVKEMAKKLGRPVSSVRRWCYKLQESGEIPQKRQARKPDNLDDRFKNPLLEEYQWPENRKRLQHIPDWNKPGNEIVADPAAREAFQALHQMMMR